MAAITTRDNDIKERLSHAFITMVAARAGCQVLSTPVDRNGIDLWIAPIQGSGTARLLIQAKATSRLARVDGGRFLSFQLDRRTYDLLRRPATCPSLLVVLDLPSEPDDWLSVDDEALILRRTAFWADLRQSPEVIAGHVSVRISPKNRFDHHAIVTFMERTDLASRGGA